MKIKYARRSSNTTLTTLSTHILDNLPFPFMASFFILYSSPFGFTLLAFWSYSTSISRIICKLAQQKLTMTFSTFLHNNLNKKTHTAQMVVANAQHGYNLYRLTMHYYYTVIIIYIISRENQKFRPFLREEDPPPAPGSLVYKRLVRKKFLFRY